MSYLMQHVARRPSPGRRGRGSARVDERTFLNRPKFCGGAHVRVYVEDTSRRKRRLRRVSPSPRFKLRIADCVNVVNLEFAVDSAELRDNSLYKIDTLLAALGRFRDGLATEAALYAERERAASTSNTREEVRCPT